MTRPVLRFVRHGETDWNAAGRLQGQHDVPLNPLGRVQAEEVGRRLAAQVPDVAAHDFVSSPLARTRETMEILRRTLGLDPAAYRVEPRLAELAFGTWEGLTWREVRRSDPAGYARREEDRWTFVPSGGESYAGVQERVAPVVDGLTGPTVMVAHGGVARTLLHRLAGVPPAEALRLDIWQGRLLTIRDGGFAWS